MQWAALTSDCRLYTLDSVFSEQCSRMVRPNRWLLLICSELLSQSFLWSSWKRHTDHIWWNKVSLFSKKKKCPFQRSKSCVPKEIFPWYKRCITSHNRPMIASHPVWLSVDCKGDFESIIPNCFCKTGSPLTIRIWMFFWSILLKADNHFYEMSIFQRLIWQCCLCLIICGM